MLNEGLLFAEKYKLIKLLGRGGFSEVWLAEYSLAGIQVSVKIYAPGTGLDDAGLKMFTQEFSMVFDMNHTNLLRPTHFDCWDRMPYLILPYCKNGSAFKYLSNNEKIPEEECWKMLHDVAAGLAYLHEKKPPLIHQDIKPDNILISDEGLYMITDFGISARVRSTIRNGMAQEQSGGTLAYMGPERFSANPKPIMASDVWSLGAMMFELMTSMPPFGNHGGVLQKNGADIPMIEEDYSQELKDIVYKCLEKETWDRPSARAIEEATYNKLHGIPIPAEFFGQKLEVDAVEPPTPGNTPLPEPAPVAEPKLEISVSEPVHQGTSGTPLQSPVKSVPLSKSGGSNKKLIIGPVVAAAVVLIGLIIAFSGGKEEEAPAPVVIEEPRINYDSLAQVKITEALGIAEQADTFVVQHEEDKYDEAYDKVESIYIQALAKLREALADRDSLSVTVASQVDEEQQRISNVLYTIYNDFKETAATLKEFSAESAEAFENRAETIRPYIENLLITNKKNDNNDEESD